MSVLEYNGPSASTNRTLTLDRGRWDFATSTFINVLQETATLTWSGIITGDGEFCKGGPGTLELYGANSYDGYTAIYGGTLKLGTDERLPDDTTVQITGTTFDLSNHWETIGNITGEGGGSPAWKWTSNSY